MYQSMWALLWSEKPWPLAALGLNAFNHPWTYQVEFFIYSSWISHIGSLSSVLISDRTYQRSVQTSSCTLLDTGSLASHTSQQVERHSSQVAYHNRSHQGCFGMLDAQGSTITAFNSLGAEGYVLYRQGFSSTVFRQWQGWLEHLQQRSKGSVWRNWQVSVLEIVYQTMPYPPLN